MGSKTPDELHWLAFQYIADELDEQRRVEFEQLLADDQLAREAMAEAVELTQAVAAAEQQVQVSARQLDRARRVAWATAALAGSLALMLAWQWMPGSPRVPNETVPPVAEDTASNDSTLEVARAWISTLGESRFVPDEAEALFASDDELAEDSDVWDDAIDDRRTATPSWMLAAVSGLESSLNNVLDVRSLEN